MIKVTVNVPTDNHEEARRLVLSALNNYKNYKYKDIGNYLTSAAIRSPKETSRMIDEKQRKIDIIQGCVIE